MVHIHIKLFLHYHALCAANALLYVCHAHFYNGTFILLATMLKIPFAMTCTINRALA